MVATPRRGSCPFMVATLEFPTKCWRLYNPVFLSVVEIYVWSRMFSRTPSHTVEFAVFSPAVVFRPAPAAQSHAAAHSAGMGDGSGGAGRGSADLEEIAPRAASRWEDPADEGEEDRPAAIAAARHASSSLTDCATAGEYQLLCVNHAHAHALQSSFTAHLHWPSLVELNRSNMIVFHKTFPSGYCRVHSENLVPR